MTLLIVDDNAETRRLLRVLCQSLSADIHEAADGEAAINACAQHHPDCVLMDVRMHPMNGLRATKTIRQQWPKISVFIVTNQDDPETHLAATEAGAAAFFSKDNLVDIPQLLAKRISSSL